MENRFPLNEPGFPRKRGKHHIRYALFPHPYGPELGGVTAAAAAFNQPLEALPTSAEIGSRSFFSVDNPHVILDTVKQAEDSRHLILRFYESQGSHQTAVLTSSLDLKKAVKTNLLEEEEKESLKITHHQLQLALRPFELVTLKVEV